MLAYGPISSTATLDPAVLIDYRSTHVADRFATLVPLLVPAAIFLIPYTDLVMAVVRRMTRGTPLMGADKEHLHHRLLNIGHSYRQSVLIMWLWAAFFCTLVVVLSVSQTQLAVLAVVTAFAVLTLLPLTMPGLRPWRLLTRVRSGVTAPPRPKLSEPIPSGTAPAGPLAAGPLAAGAARPGSMPDGAATHRRAPAAPRPSAASRPAAPARPTGGSPRPAVPSRTTGPRPAPPPSPAASRSAAPPRSGHAPLANFHPPVVGNGTGSNSNGQGSNGSSTSNGSVGTNGSGASGDGAPGASGNGVPGASGASGPNRTVGPNGNAAGASSGAEGAGRGRPVPGPGPGEHLLRPFPADADLGLDPTDQP
jgi:uncharacterized membrane protein YgcG